MPLTPADKQQVDNYLKSNQPHLAKVLLERHLKDEPFDESARKVLGKIKARYPEPTTPPPAFTTPAPIRQTTPAPAIKPKKELPPTSFTPTDENDMEAIKALIRDKRYDDADALLVLSDHPDADKLRERLAALRVSGGGVKAKRSYDEPMPDFSGRLSITIFLLIFLTLFGLIALAIWVPDAKRYPDAPGAQGLLLANKISTWILRGLLAIVVFFLVVSIAALMMPVRR